MKTRATLRGLIVLGFAGLACAVTPPLGAPPQARWTAVAVAGGVRGEIGPEGGASVAIGEFQAWIVALRLPDGRPLTGARLAIDGGMPQHGHGLPTQPRVTAEVTAGRYRIEGLKLNMHGDWILEVRFESRSGAGMIRFPVRVDF